MSSVLEDLIELEISLEIEDIKVMPKIKFKDYVNETISKAAFKYLKKKGLKEFRRMKRKMFRV